jgi:hypothetical protein
MEALCHQRGAHEQNATDRDLRDNERRARALARCADRGPSGAVEHSRDVRPEHLRERCEREEDAPDHRRPGREHEHAHVDLRSVDASEGSRPQRQQQVEHQLGNDDSQDSSGAREQQTLHKTLTEQARAPGAYGESHRRLVLAVGRARNEKTGNIHAADRQEQRNGCEKREERRSNLACRIVLQPDGVEGGAVAAVLGELLADPP